MFTDAGKSVGHGTHFKNKRGFNKIKAYQNNKIRTGGNNKTTTNSGRRRVFKEMSKIEKNLKIITSITFMTLLGFLIYVVFINNTTSIEKGDWTSHFDEKVEKDAIQYFLSVSEWGLKSKQYEPAQYNFDKVLKIDPQNVRANVGMTEVLCNRCVIEQLYCTEAKNYLNSVSKNKWISKKKAKKWQAMLNN